MRILPRAILAAALLPARSAETPIRYTANIFSFPFLSSALVTSLNSIFLSYCHLAYVAQGSYVGE